MKRIALTTVLLSLVVLTVLGQEDYLFCDYHNAKAFYDRVEYPNGKCYKVYTHPVWENGKRYVHRLTVQCR